jgi:hypothetical protein
MARALGSGAVVKYCEEAIWGTTPVLPAAVYGLFFKSETLGITKNLFQSDMINPYRSVIGLGDGNKAVAGQITTDLLPEGMEVLWKHILGNPTPVTTGSGPFTHVMKGAAGYAEGLSIEKGFTNISKYFKYSGCRFNSMTINLVQEGFHEIVWDFLGKDESVGVASQIAGAGTTPTKNGFTGYQCTIGIKNAGPGAYTNISNVVSGSMTVNNNVEADGYVLGSPFRASAVYGRREITGDFSIFFEDTVLYETYFTTGTECALKFTFDDTIGNLLVVEFPRCKLGGEAPKIADQGGVNIPFTFQARRDDTEQTDIIVSLTNSIASF